MPADIFYQIGIILLCVVLSALYSGSETALSSLRAARLESILERKPWGMPFLEFWRDKPNLVLTSILVGNNVVNIGASSIATDLSIKILTNLGFSTSSGTAIGLSIGVMTLLILIYGEVVPKTFARHNPEMVIHFLPLLLLSYYVTWPMASFLSFITRILVRLVGGRVETTGPMVTEEDIEYMIHRSTKEGGLDLGKVQMLSGVFELDDTMAKEIMVPRTEIIAFEAKSSLDQVLDIIEKHQLSRYPVYQETIDKLIGIFYTRDIIQYLKVVDKEPFSLRKFVRPPYYVPRTKKIDQLLREFRVEKTHMAIVVDEYGGTAGLVTLEDVIEEMVGEIYDEYDKQERLFIKNSEGEYILRARLPIYDLAEELAMELPEDRNFDTVGGLLMDLAGNVPEKGQEFVWEVESDHDEEIFHKLHFRVLDSDQVKIRTVKLTVERALHPVD